ncbi:MAG: chemotaxis protein CheW [Deltaproteobacteria bacterium]|nr:chemotaxis protein CheW [Deltaproteobacteria bacterium]
MDIAEIREKAKQLKDREEETASGNEETPSIKEVGIQPEPAQLEELLEDTETRPATISVPEVEVRSREEFIDIDSDSRAGDQILKSWEQGFGNAAQDNLPDVQRPESSVDEEVDESDKKGDASGAVEAIVFSLDNEDYGVEIHQVKEVIKVRDLTNVPNAPKDIMGVISLRGVVIPVMNLRGRFGMPMKNGGERIIIVRDGTGLLGLLVDTVRHVVRVPEKCIEPPPSINTIDGDLIRGIGRHKGGMFILLDMQKMLELK